jgi:FtsP/CotA-like multicopper oxidase with cupredoxin domain
MDEHGGDMASRAGFMTRRGLLRSGAALGAFSMIAGRPATALAEPRPHSSRRPGRLREYWLQADSFHRNLVPNGRDGMTGTTFKADQTSYWAVGYRAYTPGWKEPLTGDAGIGANDGIPGPTIRASVGDTIRVHFRNNDTHYGFPHSIHPHGVLYRPDSDGTWLALDPDQPGAAVPVGGTYTYEYTAVPTSVGTWPYHDHSVPQSLTGGDPIMELGAELGLFGIIAITDHETPPVDREFVLFFQDLFADEIPELGQDLDAFNGYAFVENTPTFRARLGERVRWRIAGLGKEFHVFHLHGHRWEFNGRFDDSVVFGPATTLTFEYTEDNPGRWLYHCHVVDHMMGGMVGFYVVEP